MHVRYCASVVRCTWSSGQCFSFIRKGIYFEGPELFRRLQIYMYIYGTITESNIKLKRFPSATVQCIAVNAKGVAVLSALSTVRNGVASFPFIEDMDHVFNERK